MDFLGRGEAADVMADFVLQLIAQRVVALFAGVQRDEGVDRGALDLMREADDRGLGNLGVADQRALDLRRADAMARDVDDVVDPPGDPVIALLVAAAAVAG